jgi:hypothetical protein
VQIAFKSEASGRAAHVEIVSVKLEDETNGTEVASLDVHDANVWSGNGYTTWDGTIQPSSDLKTSYDLASPPWSTAGGSSTYSDSFRLYVTLRIDGVEVVLESGRLSREAAIAT